MSHEIVRLDDDDIALAKRVAVMRQEMHERARRPDGKVLRVSGVAVHEYGTIAEVAVAKYLAIPWSGAYFDDAEWRVKRFTANDVGPIEVRSTPRAIGRLILHDRDKDDSPYVLARTHRLPLVLIVGWIMGRDGKRLGVVETLGDYNRPAIYVGEEHLRPMAELIMEDSE